MPRLKLKPSVYEQLENICRDVLSTNINSRSKNAYDHSKGMYQYAFTLPDGTTVILHILTTDAYNDVFNALETQLYNYPCCWEPADPPVANDVVLSAIKAEREYQIQQWGVDKEQSLPGFLLVMESILNKAKSSWLRPKTGRESTLQEIVQLTATGIACLEKYGVTGSDAPMDADFTQPVDKT